MIPPNRGLVWALLAVLVVWLLTTAAQLDASKGGLFAGIGIGVGAAAGGIGWFVKLFRQEGAGGADNSEALYRARQVDTVLQAIAADIRTSVVLLEELVESARETRQYQQVGRDAIAAIHRIEGREHP